MAEPKTEEQLIREHAALLQAGLDLYGIGQVDRAVACWRKAQAIFPLDPRAAEYLAVVSQPNGGSDVALPVRTPKSSDSGVLRVVASAEPVLGDALQTAKKVDKDQFLELLRQGRHEEALGLLYRLREISPDNQSVSRAIQLLKQRLQDDYEAEVGHFDRVPQRRPNIAGPTVSDELTLYRLIDGIASTADVLASSRLGRFESLRTLVTLLRSHRIAFDEPGPPPPRPSRPVPSPSRPDAAPPSAPPRLAPTPQAGDGQQFDALFRQATEAYLRRDYLSALSIFEVCRTLQPDDKRVLHNIEKLQQRVKP